MESRNELKELMALVSSNLQNVQVEVSDSQYTIKLKRNGGKGKDGNGTVSSDSGKDANGTDSGESIKVEPSIVKTEVSYGFPSPTKSLKIDCDSPNLDRLNVTENDDNNNDRTTEYKNGSNTVNGVTTNVLAPSTSSRIPGTNSAATSVSATCVSATCVSASNAKTNFTAGKIVVKFDRRMFLTEFQLVDYFLRFGLIDSARLIRDRTSGCLRGFGFIEFSSSSSSSAADAARHAAADAARRAVAAGDAFVSGVRVSVLAYRSKAQRSRPSVQSHPPPPLVSKQNLIPNHPKSHSPFQGAFTPNSMMAYKSKAQQNSPAIQRNLPPPPPLMNQNLVQNYPTSQLPFQRAFTSDSVVEALTTFTDFANYLASAPSYGTNYANAGFVGPERRQRSHRVNPYRR